MLLWKSRFLFLALHVYVRATYVLSLSIHQLIYIIKDYLLNSYIVPGTVPSPEDTEVNTVHGPCSQLSACWGSLTSTCSFSDVRWTVRGRSARARGDGSPERKARFGRWVKGCKKPLRADIRTQPWRMSMGFCRWTGWKRCILGNRKSMRFDE